MNYYERHIGDYLKDTAHLSLLEHGIYTRLLDVYYTRETPIPKSDVARLIGARSRDEKLALEAVLFEFFTLEADAYVQHRCDKEIIKFADKSGKAKRSALARWDAKRLQSKGNANGMRTHSEGNANGMLPIPSPQSQSPNPEGRRATRIPTNFEPKPEPEAEAGIDRPRELANFRDYWAAKAGKDAAKLDWQATWRQWARKADRPGISRFAKPDPAATVPGRPGRDPEIEKAERDMQNRASPSAETLAAIAKIKQRVAA